MRENIEIKKGKYDQIILDILRGKGPLSSSKMRELSLSKGIPYPTYNRRIKKLEKYGFIEIIDLIEIAEKIEEANPEVIQDCLEVIQDRKEKESEDVIQDRVKQVRMISAEKRVVH